MTRGILSRPLLSVVIPTYKRPHFLSCAIESALKFGPENDTEIIVVPNGKDESWISVAKQYSLVSNVHWHPIVKANANSARNAGASIARGEYIRFLDDDDFFLEESSTQLIEFDRAHADVSQGFVDLVDTTGNFISQATFNYSDDYCVSMLSSKRMTLPCSFIFRRKIVEKHRWDETRGISQDVAFALELARDLEIKVCYFAKAVASWRQHDGSRISTKKNIEGHLREWANILLDTTSGLINRQAFYEARREAASEGLWHCIHQGFPHNPIFWSKIIRRTQEFAPDSRPDVQLFKIRATSSLSPSTIEWILFPHRLVRHFVREFRSTSNR